MNLTTKAIYERVCEAADVIKSSQSASEYITGVYKDEKLVAERIIDQEGTWYYTQASA